MGDTDCLETNSELERATALLEGFEPKGFSMNANKPSDIIDTLGAERFFTHVLAVFPEMDEESLTTAFKDGFSSPSADQGENPVVEFSRKLSRFFTHQEPYQSSPAIKQSFASKKVDLDEDGQQGLVTEALKAFNKSIALRLVNSFYPSNYSVIYGFNYPEQAKTVSKDLGVNMYRCKDIEGFLSVAASSYADSPLKAKFDELVKRSMHLREHYGSIPPLGILIPDHFSLEMILDLIDDQLTFTYDSIEAVDTIEARKKDHLLQAEEAKFATEIATYNDQVEDFVREVGLFLSATGEKSIGALKREVDINITVEELVSYQCNSRFLQTTNKILDAFEFKKAAYLEKVINHLAEVIGSIKCINDKLCSDPSTLPSTYLVAPVIPSRDSHPSPRERAGALNKIATDYGFKNLTLTTKFKKLSEENESLKENIDIGIEALGNILKELSSVTPRDYPRDELKSRILLSIQRSLPNFSTGKALYL